MHFKTSNYVPLKTTSLMTKTVASLTDLALTPNDVYGQRLDLLQLVGRQSLRDSIP